jgi:GNAT superfamily N-acetyltransferase
MHEAQTWRREGFYISTDKSLLQVSRIHQFLSTQAYWCRGIPRETVAAAIAGSLCFGLHAESDAAQVGFARVVTDCATFAWLCDVYVEHAHRGKGLSKWMVECVLSHRDLQHLRRICLATKDAHSLYQRFGFTATKTPGNWMEIKHNDLYQKPNPDPR